MARNYTISERAIIVVGLQAGKSPPEIQKVLLEEQKRLGLTERWVPASSFEMMRRRYMTQLTQKDLWDHILNPKSVGELSKK